MRLRRMLLTSAAFVGAGVAGCTKPPGFVPVEGRVLYHDKPLTSGVVMFQPSKGPPARGDIAADGTFRLTTPGGGEGARVGTNKVRIASRQAPPGDNTGLALGRLITPPAYADSETSGLVADVKAEGNPPFEFRLKD
jgi:hypothetical protein